MPFQSVVNFDLAAGIEGELSYAGPLRCEPGVLIGATPVNNVFGRVFSEVGATPGQWAPGNTSAGVRFGIMVSPKEHASFGTTAAGTLAPTMTLPNGTNVSIMTMGEVWARSVTIANVGDMVIYNNTTGVITTQTQGTAVPGGSTQLMGAIVSRPPGAVGGLFGLRITA